MKLLVLVSLLVLTLIAPSLPLSAQYGDETRMSELIQNIFYRYDKRVLPVIKNGTSTIPLEVRLGLAPKWLDLDNSGVLHIIFWLRLLWNDPRLAWDPESHYDISTFRISSDMIWKPDISIFNKQDLGSGILAADHKSSDINVHIQSNGNVLWISPVSHKVLCEGVTYDNWPWGVQNCNLDFGSWTFDANAYDLQFYNDKDEMDLRQFGDYNQFKILSQEGERRFTRYECCEEPYVNLNFKFSLQRKYIVDPNLGRIENPEVDLP